ncbi:Gfo/Idh/MocA family protein [Paenibacillus cymbidii]|uniref:Gfo/Idh/MocA family protein n=1 Tax=Paenibacillus cymbidii TaxID=1639034 RepID=UPI001081390A|nr:Gfo/Idh/MocA family oxidoreductase [Paenibacillus cymbidii]
MKKYALVGAGSRAFHMFAEPIVKELRQHAALVGVYDTNLLRAERLSKDCGGIPVFRTFEEMLSRSGADRIIVASVDYTHDEYIIRSMEAGFDVISEKPMTTDHRKCKAVLEAERRTGRRVTVTFNARFISYTSRIKELLKQQAIGRILSVDMEWMLDTSHGADYFRRWHRYLDKSGGLLVHKSTHHFDLINWWLEEDPIEVYAFGDLRFYGPTREQRGERCLACAYKTSCEFYLDLEQDAFFDSYYRQAESADGYYRDGCVFAGDIDIYDTMSVNVRYSRGTLLTYSLNAHSPYEGWKLSINGSEGRIEARQFTSGLEKDVPESTLSLFNRKGEEITYRMAKNTGFHGGADEALRRMLFAGDRPDPLGHMADSRAGAMSLLIGDAANISIAGKRPVRLQELIGLDGERV